MIRCIFCENELTFETKSEHILLDALGGRKTTRKAICSDCNNGFGNTIDKAVADQVSQFRNLLGLKAGTGDLPPSIRTENERGERFRLRGDGIPELVQKPFTVTPIQGGGFDLQINARDEVHLASVIPHLAARLRLSEDQVWKLLEEADGAFVTRRAGKMYQRLSLGGEDSLRSISKAALCLIASVFGSEPIRTPAFDDVRDFVLSGGAKFNRERGTLDSRRLGKADILEERFGQLFNMIYVRSNDKGRTIAHFTLYNLISWQVVLAENGGISSINLALVSNPLVPSIWSDCLAADLDIPFEWLDSPNRTDVLPTTTARLNAALQAWAERSLPAAINHMTRRTFERFGIQDDHQIINGHPHLDEMIAEISDVIAHYAVDLPRKQKLTADDILKMRSLGENSSDETDGS